MRGLRRCSSWQSVQFSPRAPTELRDGPGALSERGYCTQEKRDRARAFVADPPAHGMESCPCGKWAIPTVDVFIEAGDDGAPPKRVLAIVFCPHCGLRHEKPQGPPALVDGPYLEKPS